MLISRKKVRDKGIKADALITNRKCSFCGCTKLDVLQQYSAKPEINFVKCRKCKAVTYDKLYSQAALDQIYSDYHYFSEDGTQSVTFYGVERFAEHLSKYVDFTGKDKIKILDFGGGDGSLSYFTAKQLKKKNTKMSVDITVVDYCNDLRQPDASEKVTMKKIFPIGVVEGKFDLIIASAIIEHLPALACDIKKLFSCLSGGGYIYFRTPYMYPLWRDLKKFGLDYPTSYPEHIWDLGGEWYQRLLLCANGRHKRYQIIVSKPSIVQESFKNNFWKALASYVLKAPWYVFHGWPYVGGWETVFKKI